MISPSTRKRGSSRAVVRGLAGEQAGAARAARHGLRVVMAEGHALGREPVDVGRAQDLRAEPGQQFAAPLVDDDQQDILALGHRTIAPRLGRRM
jgi:hypothetical protein